MRETEVFLFVDTERTFKTFVFSLSQIFAAASSHADISKQVSSLTISRQQGTSILLISFRQIKMMEKLKAQGSVCYLIKSTRTKIVYKWKEELLVIP